MVASQDLASEAMVEAHAGTAVESDHLEDMAAVVLELVVVLAVALEDVETTVAAATVGMEVASADTVAMVEAAAMAEAVATVAAVVTVAVAVATSMAHNNMNPATTETTTPAWAPMFDKGSAITR